MPIIPTTTSASRPCGSLYNKCSAKDDSANKISSTIRLGLARKKPGSMHSTIEFLIKHGYVVLLAWVFAEQLGLPIPSLPVVLTAGALAGTGHLSFWASLFFVAVAALSADSFWYALGRIKGIRILQFLCKISLEPDSCVRRTEGIFSKQGARSLLVAKFLPGLSTVAPPLAGIFHMRTRRFLLFDGFGSLLWAGTFLGIGFAFAGEIELIGEHA